MIATCVSQVSTSGAIKINARKFKALFSWLKSFVVPDAFEQYVQVSKIRHKA